MCAPVAQWKSTGFRYQVSQVQILSGVPFFMRYNMLMTIRHKNIGVGLALMLLAGFFIFSIPVYAEDACKIAGETDPLICGNKDTNEEEALQLKIKNVLEVVYLWIGILAVIFIVIGGIRYTTSAGDANKVKGAKNTITYSVIGLVVTLAAFAITEVVIGALDGKSPDVVASEPGAPATDGPVEVKMVQIVGMSTMRHDTEYGFQARIIPDYATNKTITWKSSNTKVATVSKTGRVKAHKPGKATITATSNNGKIAEKIVTVPEPIAVSQVSISAPPSITTDNVRTELTARILPNNAENKKLQWSLSEASQKIAKINQKGVVTLKKDNKGKYSAGTIKVTAKATNGIKDTVSITVKDSAEAVSQDRVAKLQATVKKYAWEYCGGKYGKITKDCITEAKPAYKVAARKYKTGNSNIFDAWQGIKGYTPMIAGSACVSYVITVMRDSGWDPNFAIGSVRGGVITKYFHKTNSKWHNVTNKLKNRSTKPEPGDVILHYSGNCKGCLNHILLYSGKIDGFVSTTTSASLGGWVPRSDSSSIWSYINWGYQIWRYSES